MMFIYNFIFVVFFILGSPYFVYKLIRSDKWREGLRMRLGFYGTEVSRKLTGKKTIWIHAASVGEVKAVLLIIKKIQERFPKFHIVLTTVTRTGNKIARSAIGSTGTVLYFPLDFFFSVSSAIRVIHPSLVILVESELWANFLTAVYRRKIPVALINVRMSHRSFGRFRRARFLVKKFFKPLSLITVPTTREGRKMKFLGANPQVIHVVGNLKHENEQFVEPTLEEKRQILAHLGFPQEPLILLGGSTHVGEEEILISIYQELSKEFPKLYLILAPRHPERALQVSKLLEAIGLPFQLKTKLNSENSHRVLILDTVGELERMYSIGDVVFIGKSLTRKGGQNFLEPARFGKPVVFGPHMENFEDVARTFVEEGGAIQVKDAEALEEVMRRLLKSQNEREVLGLKAKEILSSNQGSTERTLSLLAHFLVN
jgi:3-deoxy-D-manno-octulosonic-acid transferase